MADKHPYSDGVTNISPWHLEADPVRLAALGKLAEELNEAAGRVARCIIQGLDELDPDTGRTNRDELRRELADVQAARQALEMEVGDVFSLPQRTSNKFDGFCRWFDMIRKEATNGNR